MPRVKIDYVVSFSSEDPEHPANNLLAWEVSKKKWLCKKGETSCSVVLQLVNAVKISAVHIGAYHSALVEVLVARSEKGNEQYQVLVPSSVFVPPRESRSSTCVERVRSFCAEGLTSDVRDQRWDRVRVVCSQPYNKHCSYGLSFIHIEESGETAAVTQVPLSQSHSAPTAVPPRMLTLDTLSSDEDDFRPGELFAKHMQRNSDSQSSTSHTGAQIRQATSQALKNIAESSTKLMKTPISKPTNSRRDHTSSSESKSDRTRDTLLYTQDDEKPHAKIDKVVQRHKDQKEKEEKDKSQERKEKFNESFKKHKDESRTPKRRKSDTSPTSETPPKKAKNCPGDRSNDQKNKTNDRKNRLHSSSDDIEQDVCVEPHTILSDVVLVLSGYENPQRTTVRNTALALGAKVERDWTSHCTHLICAFPNTPKLRHVRSVSGDKVPVVLAEWVLQCSQRKRRLPWEWYATEVKYRRPEHSLPPLTTKRTKRSSPSPPPQTRDGSDTECDTDEEIEKVLRNQKPQTSNDDVTSSPNAERTPDETEYDLSTDEDGADNAEVPKFGGALPNFFDGHTFVIDAENNEAERLSRYIKAYGGLVLQLSEIDEETPVEYVVCGVGGGVVVGADIVARGAKRVTASWLSRCHRAGAMLTTD